MANIKINDRSFEVDKIVSFGCSFTAGEELLAHLIHEDADNIKRNKGILYWKEHFEKPGSLKVSSKEQKISWAGQVASRLNVDFEGRALGGSSLPYSLYQLEEMIYREDFSNKTLILFGVTTMQRSLHFYNHTRSIENFLIAYPQWWPKKDWDQKTVLDVFNDSMLLWLQLTYLHRLVQLTESLKGQLLLFSMNGLVPDVVLKKEEANHVIFRDKYQEILKSPYVFTDTSLLGLCKNQLEDQHGGNHPKLHIHEKFAEYVLKNLE